MEFRAAHQQSLQDGRARVIIILYSDIGPRDNLDPDLKAYLNMNTYVKYEDPWFYDKLRYALPHGPKLQKQKKNIFKNQRPAMILGNDKSDLIDSDDQSSTPPGASTPPADCKVTLV